MRILFVTNRFPYPALKGDQLIVFNRIKGLSKNFKIVLLTFYEKDSDLEGLSEINKYCEEVIPVKLSKSQSILNTIRGFLFNKLPFQVNFYKSKAFKEAITGVIKKYQIDIVHAYTLRVAEYTKHLTQPVIYELIDSMQLNLENMVYEEQFLKKWIYKKEADRIRKYEQDLCLNSSYLSVVSKKDKERINVDHIRVIPNGVDKIYFKRNKSFNPGEIIFSGNMGYSPNIHAVKWFVNECLPIIKSAKPNIKFRIVGANPSLYIKNLHDGKTIFVTGYVNSVADELSRAQISVAPMRSGSGMQNKIIEAMACGTPVITTHNGLEGLFAEPDEEILVADTPNTFSQSVIDLLSDIELYSKISKNSINYVENYHSWERSNQSLADLYLDALSDNLKRVTSSEKIY